jgi:hypothetical protein
MGGERGKIQFYSAPFSQDQGSANPRGLDSWLLKSLLLLLSLEDEVRKMEKKI